MTKLMEIKEYIQSMAQSIAYALEMDTQVVDTEYNRVGGTVNQSFPKNGGAIKQILENGKWLISERSANDPICISCHRRDVCTEKAYIHCPISYQGQVIGVMGLICYSDLQFERLVNKKELLLGFIQNMCKMIELKLKENEIYRREQEMYRNLERHNVVLNQVLNNISDGYILLDGKNCIANINQQALLILGITGGNVLGRNITEIVPDLTQNDVIKHFIKSSYDEVHINNKIYGVFITEMNTSSEMLGTIINFKTVKNFGKSITSRAFQTKKIVFDDIIGKSKKIEEAKRIAQTVAPIDPNILILGESGTGKELFARAIHEASMRRKDPFIPVNCAAIPTDLLESELFGYVEGAFTGASKGGKTGKFEMADHGTLFLDEIGDMPIHLQAKILRVLQDRKIDKVGGSEQIDINVRIIAATNKNLETLISEGKFREDLYYRLNVIPINVPPLRERDGDVEILMEHFLYEYCKTFAVGEKELSADVKQALLNYNWPGNIRELENIIQYLISISGDKREITEDMLPLKLKGQTKHVVYKEESIPLFFLEKNRILQALETYGDTTKGKQQAADALGISLTTLYRKLAKYQK